MTSEAKNLENKTAALTSIVTGNSIMDKETNCSTVVGSSLVPTFVGSRIDKLGNSIDDKEVEAESEKRRNENEANTEAANVIPAATYFADSLWLRLRFRLRLWLQT